MGQWGANRNTWAGYRMSSFRSPRTPKQRVVNRRPQNEGSSSGLVTIVVMTLLLFPLDTSIEMIPEAAGGPYASTGS